MERTVGTDSGRAGHVIFISRQRLVGAINGSSAYLIDLARAVRGAGLVPHLLQPSPDVAGRWPVLSMRPEMKVFQTHAIRGLVRIGRHRVSLRPQVYASLAMAVLRAVARKVGARGAWTIDVPMPYAIAQPWVSRDHAWLHRAARSCVASGDGLTAVADYMFCAPGFADLPDCPTAIVMHDLFHAREGGGSDSVALVDRDTELALLGRADAVIAIQAGEAAFLKREVPQVRTILAPLATQTVAATQPGEDDRLLFVASNTAPNVVGLQWFAEHVWPLLRAARPAIQLDVAGNVGRAFSSAPAEGIRLLGYVDKMDELYASAGIVISPLTFGSGLKIKLIEALGKGKAIVATPVTLQGVEEVCAGAVRVAPEPEAFAAHILELASDRSARARLGERALETANRHFGADRCYGDFVDWLRNA
ncbi:glycosyl family 2 [Novosphingobium sp. Rr 2-17]|uniref:glycosyltransferase n=1 Tax=Novosphingobium sp. Rr 2-17 TaxID=555793 RepID=UPI000269A86A|nr:glycosyltransferase family 4 protein [Novosphingobium sp. Rr 2-17]EIZ77902.1 glycosyl family 2 [Novosphingobium sp. Rr 2-17]